MVERRRLIPEVAPYDAHLSSHAQGHGGVDQAEEMIQACQAVPGGQVRRALRQRVHHREGRAAVHDARGEPPRCRAGRLLHGLHQQLADEAGDEGHVAGDVLDVPPLKGRVATVFISRTIGVYRGSKDVVEAVEEDRICIVGGGPETLHVRRRGVPQCAERLGDALGACVVVENVTTAERERVDDVRGLADGGGGEVYRGGGGFVGEGGGEDLNVVAERIGGRLLERREAAEQEQQDDRHA